METALHRIEKRLRERGGDRAPAAGVLARILGRKLRPPTDHLVFNSPARREQLAAFERRHAVVLPADVAESYLHMNGTEEYTDLDAAWMRFLPIEEWTRYHEEFPNDPGASMEPFASSFVFADHGIAASFFSIDLDPMRLGHVYALTATPHRIATSFTDFVSLVLEDDDSIFR